MSWILGDLMMMTQGAIAIAIVYHHAVVMLFGAMAIAPYGL